MSMQLLVDRAKIRYLLHLKIWCLATNTYQDSTISQYWITDCKHEVISTHPISTCMSTYQISHLCSVLSVPTPASWAALRMTWTQHNLYSNTRGNNDEQLWAEQAYSYVASFVTWWPLTPDHTYTQYHVHCYRQFFKRNIAASWTPNFCVCTRLAMWRKLRPIGRIPENLCTHATHQPHYWGCGFWTLLTPQKDCNHTCSINVSNPSTATMKDCYSEWPPKPSKFKRQLPYTWYYSSRKSFTTSTQPKILLVCSSVYYGYHTLPTDYHWVTVTKKTQISLDKIYSYTVILKSQRTS